MCVRVISVLTSRIQVFINHVAKIKQSFRTAPVTVTVSFLFCVLNYTTLTLLWCSLRNYYLLKSTSLSPSLPPDKKKSNINWLMNCGCTGMEKRTHRMYRGQFTLFVCVVHERPRIYDIAKRRVVCWFGHICSIFLPCISIKFHFEMFQMFQIAHCQSFAHFCSLIKVPKLPDVSSKKQSRQNQTEWNEIGHFYRKTLNTSTLRKWKIKHFLCAPS